MELSPLHERMLTAVGDRTYRAIAELTDSSSETVRRYMQGQAPSVEFLSALCRVLGVNEQWLISGRGPMKASAVRAHVLKEASASELLSAMATTLERLTERVEQLELFLHSLETRLRARSLSNGQATRIDPDIPGASSGGWSGGTEVSGNGGGGGTGGGNEGGSGGEAGHHGHVIADAAALGISARANFIADAVAQRPRPHDR